MRGVVSAGPTPLRAWRFRCGAYDPAVRVLPPYLLSIESGRSVAPSGRGAVKSQRRLLRRGSSPYIDQEPTVEPEQNAITESVDRLAGHIDALAAAVSAAAETLAAALRHVAPPPQMTAQGVEE
jgi:hypothetical protein